MKFIVLACVTVACDGGASGDGCHFVADLQGALTASFDSNSPMTCGMVDAGAGPFVAFYPEDPAIARISIVFGGSSITRGSVSVVSPGGFVWEADDCVIDVMRRDGSGESMRVAATGGCSGPARPKAGTGTITIGQFDFDMF